MEESLKIREHFSHRLYWSLLRPGMYGREIFLDTFYCMLLEDICFTDGRDKQIVKQYLQDKGYWSSRGVCGILEYNLDIQGQIEDELASVYAEVAVYLGYLEAENRLDAVKLNALLGFARVGSSLDQVTQKFGAPTFQTSGSGAKVLCYQDDNQLKWVTLKFDRTLKLQYTRIGTIIRSY